MDNKNLRIDSSGTECPFPTGITADAKTGKLGVVGVGKSFCVSCTMREPITGGCRFLMLFDRSARTEDTVNGLAKELKLIKEKLNGKTGA